MALVFCCLAAAAGGAVDSALRVVRAARRHISRRQRAATARATALETVASLHRFVVAKSFYDAAYGSAAVFLTKSRAGAVYGARNELSSVATHYGTSGVGGTTNDLLLLDVTPLSPVVDKDLGLAAAEVSATKKASKKKPASPTLTS